LEKRFLAQNERRHEIGDNNMYMPFGCVLNLLFWWASLLAPSMRHGINITRSYFSSYQEYLYTKTKSRLVRSISGCERCGRAQVL